MSEAEIQAAGMLLIGARADCRVFRMNIGRARDPRSGRVIQFGVRGMSDLLVMVRGGAILWLEVKSATGRLSPEQVNFRNLCTEMGHFYRVARSPHDFVLFLEEVLNADIRSGTQEPTGQ